MKLLIVIMLLLSQQLNATTIYRCNLNGKVTYQGYECAKNNKSEAKRESNTNKEPAYQDYKSRGSLTAVTVDFKSIEIRDALKIISEIMEFPIIVSEKVNGNITLNLKDTPIDDVLQAIVDNYGLSAIIVNGEILIASEEEIIKIKESLLTM